MDWLETDGVGLRYELTGEGPDTHVLVHEMGCTLESYDLVRPLLPPGLRVLRFDTRGAGLSTKLRGTAEIAVMAGDIARLLSAAGIDTPVTISGGAVGGAIALQFTADHPERTRGAVVFGPATGIPDERRQLILDYADQVEAAGMASVVDAELARAYPENLRGDAVRFRRFRARWLANDPSSYAAIFRMLAGLDMTAALAGIRCPCLFVAGESDPLRPPELIEPLSRRVAGAQFRSAATGHFAATQTPELVAEILGGFIAGLPA
ncbi:MAG: alpha/beta fold hydrolase [Bosea sp.]|uniref:alpha/beta fold hydrolase n=1 Tax=Bosea sp. (in: a-proteobacteria) TaxID=1871050 RepID=UPI0010F51530|nr:alpha/beta fold hydrolase [Bosea sp. (in: a-proteobacteria)]MCP4734851.1 alpha/beta fold hydrolase [Bosea sp. (in: a-proteobacteria)]